MEAQKKPDSFWKEKLTPTQFFITRMKGTEPPFSGVYNDHFEPGVYRCVGCDQPLFTSETKFHSGMGWPSFWDTVDRANLTIHQDNSFGIQRVEVTCSNCGAHLGHVFSDGPRPTGLRYCINSAALTFDPAETGGDV